MSEEFVASEKSRSERADCERDYELELKMPRMLERYHALLDPRRVRMRKGALAPGKVVGASKPAKKDWSLTWDGGLESKQDGKDEKWKLDTDHSWEFESESKESMSKQEKASPVNISERKELHADDLYSDDVKWTTPNSSHESRGNPRNMVTDYAGVMTSPSWTKYEGAPVPKSLPMSNRVLQMNYALCRLTDPPLPIRISDALHPFFLFYDVQRPCAVSLENLLGFYGIILYQLLWGDKEHLWAIYSPADANVCMSYALKTWSRVQNHDPRLFSQEYFESMKLSSNFGEVKRSDQTRELRAGSSSLLHGSERQSKEIENHEPSDISKSREFSEKNFKKEALLQNYRARIMFEELYSNLTKSPFDNHVKLNGIYSSVQKLLGKYEIYQMLLDAWFGHKCGHASYDDFTEFPGREGAVVDFAKELMKAGYITRAQITNQPLGTKLRQRKNVEGLGDFEVEKNRVYSSKPVQAGDYVDHSKPNDLPPTTNEYDFAPPPPPKMVPPIGPEHMLHLFQDCPSISDVKSNFYLQRIPRRKIEPIAFNANRLSENLG
ncbi:hypothetical protein BOTNAR_0225g00070 [Botryotinia narcissicola]|uniref:Uncharacterized protein n=1 Tax=Botryotinia narcissicola TaxID=278944 RepID=A0A4Z1IBM1_9HELO|nr:hypothetical protein BOTNAR_0225g00070 [Botryotinia narcissicola]